VLANFLSLFGYSQKFLPIGLAKLREPLTDQSPPVHVVPYALEMLKIVQKKHFLSIVTIGVPSLQLSKLKNAGIDPLDFSKINVIEERDKKPSYRALIDEAGLQPQEDVVCGDRIAIDLAPAKELYCHTVHVAWGRGSHMREDARTSASVDYVIDDWSVFAALLENIENAVSSLSTVRAERNKTDTNG
jgi:FMN phosphatase YigB (HAD superfamily)